MEIWLFWFNLDSLQMLSRFSFEIDDSHLLGYVTSCYITDFINSRYRLMYTYNVYCGNNSSIFYSFQIHLLVFVTSICTKVQTDVRLFYECLCLVVYSSGKYRRGRESMRKYHALSRNWLRLKQTSSSVKRSCSTPAIYAYKDRLLKIFLFIWAYNSHNVSHFFPNKR